MLIMIISHIEKLFQKWLGDVNEYAAYILSSSECAARHAYEAGYNRAYSEIENQCKNVDDCPDVEQRCYEERDWCDCWEGINEKN